MLNYHSKLYSSICTIPSSEVLSSLVFQEKVTASKWQHDLLSQTLISGQHRQSSSRFRNSFISWGWIWGKWFPNLPEENLFLSACFISAEDRCILTVDKKRLVWTLPCWQQGNSSITVAVPPSTFALSKEKIIPVVQSLRNKLFYAKRVPPLRGAKLCSCYHSLHLQCFNIFLFMKF